MFGRFRTLKPELALSEKLAGLSPHARIAFPFLACFADVAGRLEDRPARLKAVILPYDDCDFADVLTELETIGFVRRYQVAGKALLWLPGFRKHQKPSTKERRTTSDLPPHPDDLEPATKTERTGSDRGTNRKRTRHEPVQIANGSRNEPERTTNKLDRTQNEPVQNTSEPGSRDPENRPAQASPETQPEPAAAAAETTNSQALELVSQTHPEENGLRKAFDVNGLCTTENGNPPERTGTDRGTNRFGSRTDRETNSTRTGTCKGELEVEVEGEREIFGAEPDAIPRDFASATVSPAFAALCSRLLALWKTRQPSAAISPKFQRAVFDRLQAGATPARIEAALRWFLTSNDERAENSRAKGRIPWTALEGDSFEWYADAAEIEAQAKAEAARAREETRRRAEALERQAREVAGRPSRLPKNWYRLRGAAFIAATQDATAASA